jgi:putative AbiEii toxin of type IV toxin-antitoxin system
MPEEAIRDLTLTLSNYRCFSDENPVRLELDATPIALVGENNSGKSSILRAFTELRSIFALLSSQQTIWGQALSPSPLPVQPGRLVRDPAELFNNANVRPLTIIVEVAGTSEKSIDKAVLSIDRALPQSVLATFCISDETFRPPGGTTEQMIVATHDIAQAFRQLSQSFYIDPLRTAANVVSNALRENVTLGQALIQDWAKQKQSGNQLQRARTELVEGKICDAFGFRSFSLGTDYDRSLFELIINGKTYGLSEVGTGISQFIFLLCNALGNPDLSYLLIDEPEANLHPQLQVALIDLLQEFADTVIFATHSLGLAEVRAKDIYAVTAREGKHAVRKVTPKDRLKSMLAPLTFSGFEDVGSRSVLLVEGVHDRPAIKAILKKMNHEHDVSVLHLNGRTSINGEAEPMLRDITRFGDNLRVYALIDSEKDSEMAAMERSREEFMRACEAVGITAHVLERRAMENYISDAAVKWKYPGLRSLGEYEPLKSMPNHWGKAHNWLLFSQMSLQELEGTDLGWFVRRICSDLNA